MAYSTVDEVINAAGVYKGVYDLEAVGTGDGNNKTFSLDFNPVVEGSEKIYVDGTLKTVTTDYTINYKTGVITFVAAPGDTLAVTATYNYFTITLDSDVVTEFITEADAWIDRYTGRTWETKTATDEVYDGNDQTWLVVRADHTPIISLTALTIGSTSITVGNVYVYSNTGKLVLGTDAEVSTFLATNPQNITMTYTYGESTTPEYIKGFARRLAAVKSIVSIMGGTYDDVTSWTIGSMTAAVGEPWVNLARTAEKLDKELKSMLNDLKKRPVIL